MQIDSGSILHEIKHAFPNSGYVRLKSILAPDGPLPISRSGFWAGVRDGKYPRPRKLSSRVTVWKATDILALLERIESGHALRAGDYL